MRGYLKLIKLVLLVAVLSLSACKNDEKSETKEDAKENNMENVDERNLGVNQVPGVLMTMHKMTRSYLDIGMEKSKNPKVKEYIKDFKIELTVVEEKSEYVFKESELEVKDTKLSNFLGEKFKKTEERLRAIDEEKYDQVYMKNLVDYLFEQLRIVETELIPIKEERKLGEAVHLTMLTYKIYADRALNLLKEIETEALN